MLKRTSIGWADYSGGDLNVVIRGKSCPISEGCAHCYVERWFQRYRKGRMPQHTTLYDNKLKRLATAQFSPGDQPYRRGLGSKPIMFVADYGDLFCEDVSFDFAFNVLSTIYPRSDADWVLLTKRPGRMKATVDAFCNAFYMRQLPAHIWCLTTVETQEWADRRIPLLLQVKAQVLGVSLEPMLEPIDLRYVRDANQPMGVDALSKLNWVIVGAESGADRRHFERWWAYLVHEHCAFAGVPFFGKQSSGLGPGVPLLIGGREIKEFPR